jgi:MFS family permease
MTKNTKNGGRQPRRHFDLAGAIAISLIVQTVISLLAASPPVLASHIAANRGWNVGLVAFYAPIAYLVGFLTNFGISKLLARFGGMGLSLLLVASGVLGLICLLLPNSFIVVFTPIFVGLAIGAMNPASSEILGPRTTPTNAGLIMSIKQTGVPIGAALAGILVPLGILWRGNWQDTVIGLAGLGVLTIIVFAPTISWLNGPRRTSKGKAYRPLDAVRMLWKIPGMNRLLVAGSAFAAVQLSMRSFLTVYLVNDVGFDLRAAGLAFSVSQMAGIVGQIGWAVASDRIMTTRSVMGLVGALMLGGSLLTAMFDASWSTFAILSVAALYGLSAGGFIPLVLAEVARRGPADQVGVLTGAANLFLIGGVLVGPLLFGGASALWGNAAGFLALAACALGGTIVVLSSYIGGPNRISGMERS